MRFHREMGKNYFVRSFFLKKNHDARKILEKIIYQLKGMSSFGDVDNWQGYELMPY